ncbi:MAG TPA: hypothetical protein VMH04_04885 [Candidatus Solibacter sp.]|nr:hypothetical protein [Candidatus Solibacter sp.]
MNLAIVLVVVAVVALVLILRTTVSRSLQVSSGAGMVGQLQPIDIEAFRNLIDPAEDDYLRRRLPPAEFRSVRRERLRAVAAYVATSGRNAAVLIHIGQVALAADDAHTAEAARQMVNDALLLRRNAAFALLRIYLVLAWPGAELSAAPVLHGYERLNSSAMLLGRLQNPSAPMRIAAW